MSTPQEIARRASSTNKPVDHHYLRWLFICDDILQRVKRDKPDASPDAVDYSAIAEHLQETIRRQRWIIESGRKDSGADISVRMKSTLANIRPMTEVHLPALRALYDQDAEDDANRLQAVDCIDRMIKGVAKLTEWIASVERMQAIVEDIRTIISSPGYEPKYLG